MRNDYGGGTKYLQLDGKVGDEIIYSHIPITIEEKSFGQKELEEQYECLEELLIQEILQDNASTNDVRTDLNLVHKIPGLPFSITWESDCYELVDEKGKLGKREDLEVDGKIVLLTARIIYPGFERLMEIPVCVRPEELSPKEQEKRDFIQLVNQALEENPEGEEIILPDDWNGKPIEWKESKKWSALFFFLVGALAALALAYAADYDLERQVREREKQLLQEYPIFVNRLSLYLSAGVSMKNALYRIANASQKEKTVVGEELRYCCRSMERGVSEITAIENFGKHCHVSCYEKISAILIKGLKMGGGHLMEQMGEEMENAYEMRRNTARKSGEEASTKLLIPMLMMLCVVMVIILVPAFSEF